MCCPPAALAALTIHAATKPGRTAAKTSSGAPSASGEAGTAADVLRTALGYTTWVLFAGVLLLRAGAGWRGRKAAIMTVTVSVFAAITWAAHARLGNLLFKS